MREKAVLSPTSAARPSRMLDPQVTHRVKNLGRISDMHVSGGRWAYEQAHPGYYESPIYMEGQEYLPLFKEYITDDWSINRDRIWLGVRLSRGVALPPLGFKIHISATVEEAQECLRRVVPILLEARCDFKIARTVEILRYLNSRGCPRETGGKFMTAYPEQKRFGAIIAVLGEATSGLRGPHILSDQRYAKDAPVFYRFGSFTPGGLTDDVRTPYSRMPQEVNDPFGRKTVSEYRGPLILKERYLVQRAIHFSNSGGVFVAEDRLEGGTQILKEARPFIELWTDEDGVHIDAVSALAREHSALLALEKTGVTPRPVDFFTQDGHAYLVQERIGLPSLRRWRGTEGRIAVAAFHRPDELIRICLTYLEAARAIAGALERVHREGWVIGDLSPSNVMIGDSNPIKVRIIDLEGASNLCGDDEVVSWYTPGFSRPGKPSVQGDWRSLGRLVQNMVLPVQHLAELDEEVESSIWTRLVSLGLPECLVSAVQAFEHGENYFRMYRNDNGSN